MRESAASASESRPGRLSDCLWCGGKLDPDSRADTKYCKPKCRKDASRQTGVIGSVRRLKCGKMSYTIHGPENGLRPGDVILWGKD